MQSIIYRKIPEAETGIDYFHLPGLLICYNPANVKIKLIADNPDDPTSLPHNNLTNVLIDAHGKIWTTMYRVGVAEYDPEDNSFEVFQNDPFDSTSLNDRQIETMYLDSDGEVWLGAYDNGLNRFND